MKRGDRAAAIGFGGTIHRVTLVRPVPGGWVVAFEDGHHSGWPGEFVTRDPKAAEILSARAKAMPNTGPAAS